MRIPSSPAIRHNASVRYGFAEMLDSIPIFARRVGFRHGLGIAICAMAAGKFAGSLLYFILGVHDWV